MDKQLWQNILEGDQSAYQQLYFAWFKKFYTYGKKFSLDPLLIEDSIQEVFLLIWNKREKIAQLHSPNSYFFGAFRFILLDKLRQAKRITAFNFEDETLFLTEQATYDQENDPARVQKLKAALQSLTPRQREVIFLRFYEGLSYEEIANVLNITVKATYKIMARSLGSLKEQLLVSITTLMVLLQNMYAFAGAGTSRFQE